MNKIKFFTRNREYLIKILIEIFSVIFAVVLALFINEHRSRKENIQYAEIAIHNIRVECDSNRYNLELAVHRHDTLINILDSIITLYEQNKTGLQLSVNSLSVENISGAAWEATKNTNAINYIDFNLLMEISANYDEQKIYYKLVDGFFKDQFLNPRNMTEEDFINKLYSFHSYLVRFSDFSHQYIEHCEKLIQLIDEKYPGIRNKILEDL